jgi:hypothetical protein
LIRRSSVKSPSACATPEGACVALVAKAVLALKVKAVSVDRRDHQKVATLVLAALKEVDRREDLKEVAQASGDLVGLKAVVQGWRVVACLVIPKSPSNAWTRTATGVSLKKNMSTR